MIHRINSKNDTKAEETDFTLHSLVMYDWFEASNFCITLSLCICKVRGKILAHFELLIPILLVWILKPLQNFLKEGYSVFLPKQCCQYSYEQVFYPLASQRQLSCWWQCFASSCSGYAKADRALTLYQHPLHLSRCSCCWTAASWGGTWPMLWTFV